MSKLLDNALHDASQKLITNFDFEVLCEHLMANGWTAVELDRFNDNSHAIDVVHWTEANVTGKYHKLGRKWIFEKSQDAVLFRLRWT